MTTRDRIEKLAGLCKASVSITYNEHTTNYETVEQYVRWVIENLGGNFEEERPVDLDKMIENDSVVEVHFYPHTPIGFYNLIGYDLDRLLDEAIEIVEREAKSAPSELPEEKS